MPDRGADSVWKHSKPLPRLWGAPVNRREPAAEAIRAERLGHAVRPDLYAAIVDHGQRHAVAIPALGALAERLGRAARPEDLNIHAHQLPFEFGAHFLHLRGRPPAGH